MESRGGLHAGQDIGIFRTPSYKLSEMETSSDVLSQLLTTDPISNAYTPYGMVQVTVSTIGNRTDTYAASLWVTFCRLPLLGISPWKTSSHITAPKPTFSRCLQGTEEVDK